MADTTSTQPVGGEPFPPRPKAIATFLATNDFLPGCQTLLHSVKVGEYAICVCIKLFHFQTGSLQTRRRTFIFPFRRT